MLALISIITQDVAYYIKNSSDNNPHGLNQLDWASGSCAFVTWNTGQEIYSPLWASLKNENVNEKL